MWSSGGPRLFDPTGQEFRRAAVDLTRADVDQVLTEGRAHVAVVLCGMGVTWAERPQRRAIWEKQVRKDFEDVDGWRPPHDAPGTLPFRAEIWQSTRDDSLALVFTNE